MSRGIPALVGLLVVAQSAVCTAPAQQAPMKLNVFAPPVLPNAPIYLNVTLTNPTDRSILELRQTMTFRREEVRFVRARLGVAGDLAGAALTVDLMDGSGTKVEDEDAAERLDIHVRGKSPLPTGPLVELEFKQVEGKEQLIKLRTIAEVRDAEGNVLPGLRFHDTTVSVSKTLEAAPLKILGCLFYMH